MKIIHAILVVFSLWIMCALAHEDELSIENKQRVKSIQTMMRKALAQGDSEKMKGELEQAISNFHAVEIELAMIQTLMQAGEYRHALSAAAHTQAEHPEVIDSTLFYAYLLAIGGQTIPATQLLETTLQAQANSQAQADSKALKQLLAQIKQQQLNSQTLSSELTNQDIQLYPFSEINHIKLNHVSNGVIVGDGTQVITTLDILNSINLKPNIGVRNGLGRQEKAELTHTFPQLNLALLTLKAPLNKEFSATIAHKPAFAGTPYYLSGYRLTSPEQADWPILKIDILGLPNNNLAYQTHIQNLVAGSPAYNNAGELIGIISTDSTTSKMVVMPLSALLNDIKTTKSKEDKITNGNSSISTAPQNPLISKKPMDALYEETLSTSVQVLIE